MTVDRVSLQTPEGRVTLLPKRAPVGSSGAIRGRTVTVVPASAASDGQASDDQASDGQASDGGPAGAGGVLVVDARVRAALPAAEVTAFRAALGPDEAPAVAVFDLGEGEAVALGRALGLDAVFFWDGRRARLVACR